MILAGLTPDTIMDIAARGMAFYSFQMSFEQVRLVYALLTVRCSVHSAQMQLTAKLNERNQTIASLEHSIKAWHELSSSFNVFEA